MSRPPIRIVLSCDDGLGAPGQAALARELARLGTVRAVAPLEPSSGAGHAVSLHLPVGARRGRLDPCEQAVAVLGTPADAVKLALSELWPGWADLVASGINCGPNVGVNVFYSGTVGAAAEGAALGVPALAVSLDVSDPCDFEAAALRARPVLERLAGLMPFPPGLLFNVNLPASQKEVRGLRLTRHGRSGFREFYRPHPPPAGREAAGDAYYQVYGQMRTDDPDDWTDAAALAAGFISVTPMFLDLTAEPLRARQPRERTALESLIAGLADWSRPQ